MGTYETIKKLPAKGYDWDGFIEALTVMWKSQQCNTTREFFKHTTDRWESEKGMRGTRTKAMEIACMIVHDSSIVSGFIPPSEETLSWGGFLGGEYYSYQNEENEEKLTNEIIELSKKFYKA